MPNVRCWHLFSLTTRLDATLEIAKQYDVQLISPRDMADMSQKLYENGSISFKQHSLISFQPEFSPQYEAVYGKISEPDSIRSIS